MGKSAKSLEKTTILRMVRFRPVHSKHPAELARSLRISKVDFYRTAGVYQIGELHARSLIVAGTPSCGGTFIAIAS